LAAFWRRHFWRRRPESPAAAAVAGRDKHAGELLFGESHAKVHRGFSGQSESTAHGRQIVFDYGK